MLSLFPWLYQRWQFFLIFKNASFAIYTLHILLRRKRAAVLQCNCTLWKLKSVAALNIKNQKHKKKSAFFFQSVIYLTHSTFKLLTNQTYHKKKFIFLPLSAPPGLFLCCDIFLEYLTLLILISFWLSL